MKKIEYLFKTGRISRIVLTEKKRYLDFFSNSYKENLSLSKHIIESFPRWSIISGYYAMHDLTKLFLADVFNIKIDYNVHETTILVMKEISKDKETIDLLNSGYNEFILLLNDLASAKSQRTKAQYYTGTEFMREKYKKDAKIFFNESVVVFTDKIKGLRKNAD